MYLFIYKQNAPPELKISRKEKTVCINNKQNARPELKISRKEKTVCINNKQNAPPELKISRRDKLFVEITMKGFLI